MFDLCHGFQQVLDSGYHPDTAAATAAWRDLVGSSAASAQPEPANDDLLAHVLPGAGPSRCLGLRSWFMPVEFLSEPKWPDMLRVAGSLVTNQVRAYDLLRMFGRDGRPTPARAGFHRVRTDRQDAAPSGAR